MGPAATLHHRGDRRARRRCRPPCARARRRRAGVARRLPRLVSGARRAAGADDGSLGAALADALPLALRRRHRGDRGRAGLSRHLAAQRLLPMGLHGAGATGGRCAVARPHARLAVSRARPPRRGGAHARAGGRVFQRHLAGLCGRADRDGAGPLRRVDQPGAAVAAHATSPAARARHRRQRDEHLAQHPPHPARPAAARRVRGLRGVSPRRAAGSRRRRSPGR